MTEESVPGWVAALAATPASWILVGALGLIIGSFLTVVASRVPEGLSVVRPPSSCPHCGHRLQWHHNVPVLGYLVLRGRCASCRAPISIRYPLIELSTAGLFLLMYSLVGLGPELPLLWFFVAIAVALSAIDLETYRLPNAIVLPSYPVVMALSALAVVIGGRPERLLTAALAAAAMFALYLTIALIAPRGMGLGDVKTSGVIGWVLGFFGWPTVLVGLFAAFLIGSILATAAAIRSRSGLGTRIPFGPSMFAGAVVGLVGGDALFGGYLRLFGL